MYDLSLYTVIKSVQSVCDTIHLQGKTALTLAGEKGCAEVLHLLAAGALTDTKDSQASSACDTQHC